MQSTCASAQTSPRIERSPTIDRYSSHLHALLEQKFNAASFFGVIRFSLFPILPENMKNICQSQASVYDLAPLNFRRRVTRPVSYYALF